ncbi:HigA family addiction module antitoxin [Endozoicomonas sp. 4G]|uniref:HigA family addiction module antitoxin n=1 Tax=Endozoicomonas sp. 4G TaxID=2872754 RepID=UPI00207875EF|nr:HigA family addiction module antitoxin [Endozoicomonas sp. 4G]
MSRTRNRKPTHPGVVFRLDVLEPAGISVTKAAEVLDVSRKHLSEFVNQKKPCTRDLAIRIAIATNTSVASWLNMQTSLDVWEAEHQSSDFYMAVGSLALKP